MSVGAEHLLVLLDVTLPADVFEESKDAVVELLMEKMKYNKKDEVCLILFGSLRTCNPLASPQGNDYYNSNNNNNNNNNYNNNNNEDDEGYRNVSIERGPCIVDISFVNFVRNLQRNTTKTKADYVDAVIVGVNEVIQAVDRRRIEKRIFLITDGRHKLGASARDDLKALSAKMLEKKIKFNILGIGFRSETDESNNTADLRTPAQKSNQAVLQRFVDEIDGALFTFKEGLELLRYFRKKTRRSTTVFRGMLELSPAARIPCHIYLKAAEEKMPTLKKKSALALSAAAADVYNNNGNDSNRLLTDGIQVKKEKREPDNDDDDNDAYDDDGGYNPNNNSTPVRRTAGSAATPRTPKTPGNVLTNTTYVRVDDPDEDIKEEDRVKGYKYGRSMVPFNKVDEEALKLKADKGIKLITFVNDDVIGRHLYKGSAYQIVPWPDHPASHHSLDALVEAMAQTKSHAVVRYVRTERGTPQLAVLTPWIRYLRDDGGSDDEEEDDDGNDRDDDGEKRDRDDDQPRRRRKEYNLVMNVLPFSEDLRRYYFLPFNTKKVTDAQLDGAAALIDAFTITSDTEPSFLPSETFNPALQRYYDILVKKQANPNTVIGPPPQQLLANVTAPAAIASSDAAVTSLQQYHQNFPLINRQKKNVQFQIDWEQQQQRLLLAGGDLKSYRGDGNKRLKLAGGGDGDYEDDEEEDNDGNGLNNKAIGVDPASSKVRTISIDDPISDFNAMLANRTMDLVESAIKQMTMMITSWVDESIRNAFYDKALACLRALREGCVREEEPEKYNLFLIEMRETYEGKKRDAFWTMIREEGLTLISDGECSDSSVSKAEASVFFTPEWKRKYGSRGNDDDGMSGLDDISRRKDNDDDDLMNLL